MNITKEHIGKTIYGVPTGNNARWHPKPYEEFEVISVARVYVKLRKSGYSREEEYRIDNGCDKRSHQSGYNNAGYDWRESIEEIERDNEQNKTAKSISQSFNYGAPHYLNYDDIMAIKAIMDAAKVRESK